MTPDAKPDLHGLPVGEFGSSDVEAPIDPNGSTASPTDQE
jgi:hypothetical protein